jgi:uncharacterized protein with LGFP repeats
MNNRRQRRFQLKAAGMLRIKNMYGPFSEVGKLWYNKAREEGAKLHAQNVQRNEEARDRFFNMKENAMRLTYQEMGYTKEQVDLLIEAWSITVIKDPETYRSDRKRAKELRKQAKELVK